MGYTELKGMKSGKEIYKGNGLADQALLFIRDSCEGLRFDPKQAGKYTGKSLKPDQIPYNMEKDIDRLCLENALKRFLRSGRKDDAFDVYFCYLEMFVGSGSYDKTRRMIELLSEYEANGSRLLMSHRDHYSHSVYVFALGLAVYQSNSVYRAKYNKFYGLANGKGAACHYLKYWGLASLFHDIGYPFELPFEQVASYFEVNGNDRKERPYISYHKLEDFLKIQSSTAEKLKKIYGGRGFADTNELFAYVLSRQLGDTYSFTEEQLRIWLTDKPAEPNKFNHFMDHAYFSASVLFNKLFDEMNCEMDKEHIDAITAILLHNSLYKFNIAHYKDSGNIPFKAELHPVAYMLMLCDELQCWDRIAYGRNSRTELHPMSCEFDFKDNGIYANYKYDIKEIAKVNRYKDKYIELMSLGDSKGLKDLKLKAYSKMYAKSGGKTEFEDDIERIVDLSGIKLKVETTLVSCAHSGSRGTLSGSNFIHLHDFAIVLNGRWGCSEDWKKAKNEGNVESFIRDEERKKAFASDFDKLSLEYKLSNINQAKAFAGYMDVIGCFYSDSEVDFETVEGFSEEEMLRIGILEHKRWLQEHYDMGWTYGKPEKENRERVRQHKDMIPGFDGTEVSDEKAEENYRRLDKAEQDKDTDPMDCMLALLKMYDGIRIYRLR